ncbi:hypothetical protein TVAG_019800 [Trichomonas vaginalis G3]|uniref:P/Homo B domain-containing protein n=1 Tax=Trichomonas vaginalis (strain ATCC PRA-98 / G3) TaxID=412133 RepID=A2DX52_TRIV3|nr:serine-type endopeptidase protein [Trichomonas vaginalis G3]EAY15079.1 hypothetical protein TVAG_019800 [Trichomonas vaginalis G3]KAI5549645.1 serine-type endopeptidase protein [Trichomonas vaginalis G3]|eukprot:XP_001327302.1 hypothetical protein [Trichomonas vaginalis G3]
MGDGAHMHHEAYKGRILDNEFINGFDGSHIERPPKSVLLDNISESSLLLAAGKYDYCNSRGIAPGAKVGSYYFFDNSDHTEDLTYLICYRSDKWDISILTYQNAACSGRNCKYFQPTEFHVSIASKCLYHSSNPKIIVVPIPTESATDVIFAPPAGWPLIFTIAGVTNRGMPLNHAAEGTGIFMAAPVAGIAPISGADAKNPTECIENFTSPNASAAIFAGGLAILKEANPNLNLTDLFFITAMTADKVCPESPLWSKNSFGLWFNRKVGFGRLNLNKSVELARNWTSLGGFTKKTGMLSNINHILGNETESFRIPINASENDTVLFVNLQISGVKLAFGSLVPHLISPSGTKCEMKLLTYGSRYLNITNVTLPSYMFLGEKLNGNWTVEFRSVDDSHKGVLLHVALQIYYTSNRPQHSPRQKTNGPNPYQPFNSSSFVFSETKSVMNATHPWKTTFTSTRNINESSHILCYLQGTQNISRTKVQCDFVDNKEIHLDYVPSVYRTGLPMNFVVESLDPDFHFSSFLPIEYINAFDDKPGIISFEAKEDGNCNFDIDSPLSLIIDNKTISANHRCILVKYSLDFNDTIDDGYSASLTASIINYDSLVVLNRTFSRNVGYFKWSSVVPDSKKFIFQLSASSDNRNMNYFKSITLDIFIEPHEGRYSPPPSSFPIWNMLLIMTMLLTLTALVIKGLYINLYLTEYENIQRNEISIIFTDTRKPEKEKEKNKEKEKRKTKKFKFSWRKKEVSSESSMNIPLVI